MHRISLVIISLFLLVACASQDISSTPNVTPSINQESTNTDVIDVPTNSDTQSETDELVTMYEPTEDTFKNLNEYLVGNQKLIGYMKQHNYDKPLIKYENNILKIYLANTKYPTISIWQEANGKFGYFYYQELYAKFTYTKNNTVRNATLMEYSVNGELSGITEEYWPNYTPYYQTHLIANEQKFTIDVVASDKKIFCDGEPIIFTEDLANKILEIYPHLNDTSIRYDDSIASEIIKMLKETGKKKIFEPFEMGKSIDDRLAEIDEIKPLLSRECNGENYNLTGYYIVSSHHSYGLVDENHVLVYPIINDDEPFVWSNRDLFVDDWNAPNATSYHISGGYGGAFSYLLSDGKDVYIYSVSDDGPGRTTKLTGDFNNKSIPVMIIQNVKPSIPEWCDSCVLGDDYSYDKIGYGLMNQKGELVTTKVYDTMDRVLDYYVAVSSNGKHGYLNDNGQEVVPLEYESAEYVYEEYGIVSKNGKYGVINMDNQVVIDLKYDKLSYYGHNTFVGYQNGEWKVIFS